MEPSPLLAGASLGNYGCTETGPDYSLPEVYGVRAMLLATTGLFGSSIRFVVSEYPLANLGVPHECALVELTHSGWITRIPGRNAVAKTVDGDRYRETTHSCEFSVSVLEL